MRSEPHGRIPEKPLTVGDVSSIYYSLLFLHKGNKRVYPNRDETADDAFSLLDPYVYERRKAQVALAFVKDVPAIKEAYAEMPSFLSKGYRISKVRLAHELGNLTSEDVVSNVFEIKSRNTNSIGALLVNIVEQAKQSGVTKGNFRVVSPYLFTAQYEDEEGNVFFDGAKEMLRVLEEYPELSFEIVTNSVLTSDNFFTQSVIDMDTAPRLLLPPEMQKIWLSSTKESELNPEFVDSEQ